MTAPLNLPIFRVFLSSTWHDLRKERQAVENAIHSLRESKFVGMEFFGSDYENPLDASLRRVDESDVFIGIFGRKYGSGITEQEYDRARENNIPCFWYLAGENLLHNTPTTRETDDLINWRRFRDRLVENHIIQPFTNPDNLAQQVTATLHSWLFDQFLAPRLQEAIENKEAVLLEHIIHATVDQSELRQAVINSGFDLQERSIHDLLVEAHNLTINFYTGGFQNLSVDYSARIKNFLIEYLGRPEFPVAFGGRDREFEALNAWLDGQDTPPYLMLSAPAGRGKSALVVRWSQQLLNREDHTVIVVPVSIRFRTNLQTVVFSALIAALARFRGENVQNLASISSEMARGQITEYLSRPLPKKKRLLVIIDGIDEAADWKAGPDLFPTNPPEGLKILVTARSNAIYPDGNAWKESLGWTVSDLGQALDLNPLTREGLNNVLIGMAFPLEEYSKRIDVARELYRLSEGDPLLVQLYVNDLWKHRDQAVLLKPEALPGIAPGLDGYFSRWWRDQEELWEAQGDDPMAREAVEALLDLLSVAMGPLKKEDILYLIGEEYALTTRRLERALHPLSRFIIGDGVHQGYIFSHPRLGYYFFNQLSISEQRNWESRFIQWGSYCLNSIRSGSMKPATIPEYILQYYGAHLERNGSEVHLLMELISEDWYRIWEVRDDGISGFMTDVQRVWRSLDELNRQHICEGNPAGYLGEVIRCAFLVTCVNSQAQDLPIDEYILRLETNTWSSTQALAHCRLISNSEHRITLLLNTLPYLSGNRLDDIVNDILERIPNLDSVRSQVIFFSHLSPFVNRSLIQKAFRTARMIGSNRPGQFLDMVSAGIAHIIKRAADLGQIDDSLHFMQNNILQRRERLRLASLLSQTLVESLGKDNALQKIEGLDQILKVPFLNAFEDFEKPGSDNSSHPDPTPGRLSWSHPDTLDKTFSGKSGLALAYSLLVAHTLSRSDEKKPFSLSTHASEGFQDCIHLETLIPKLSELGMINEANTCFINIETFERRAKILEKLIDMDLREAFGNMQISYFQARQEERTDYENILHPVYIKAFDKGFQNHLSAEWRKLYSPQAYLTLQTRLLEKGRVEQNEYVYNVIKTILTDFEHDDLNKSGISNLIQCLLKSKEIEKASEIFVAYASYIKIPELPDLAFSFAGNDDVQTCLKIFNIFRSPLSRENLLFDLSERLLSDKLMPQALSLIRAFPPAYHLAVTLASIATSANTEQQEKLYAEALDMASGLTSPSEKVKIFALILPQIPWNTAKPYAFLASAALNMVSEGPGRRSCTSTLSWIFWKHEFYEEVFALTSRILDPTGKARVLVECLIKDETIKKANVDLIDRVVNAVGNLQGSNVLTQLLILLITDALRYNHVEIAVNLLELTNQNQQFKILSDCANTLLDEHRYEAVIHALKLSSFRCWNIDIFKESIAHIDSTSLHSLFELIAYTNTGADHKKLQAELLIHIVRFAPDKLLETCCAGIDAFFDELENRKKYPALHSDYSLTLVDSTNPSLAYNTALLISNDRIRWHTLDKLAVRYIDKDMIDRAMDSTLAIASHWQRGRTFSAILEKHVESNETIDVQSLLSSITQIKDPLWKAYAQAQLLPLLKDHQATELFESILQLSQQIENPNLCSTVLIHLLAYCRDDAHFTRAYEKALSSIEKISLYLDKDEVLSSLSRKLNLETHKDHAVSAALSIQSLSIRASALEKLVYRLSVLNYVNDALDLIIHIPSAADFETPHRPYIPTRGKVLINFTAYKLNGYSISKFIGVLQTFTDEDSLESILTSCLQQFIASPSYERLFAIVEAVSKGHILKSEFRPSGVIERIALDLFERSEYHHALQVSRVIPNAAIRYKNLLLISMSLTSPQKEETHRYCLASINEIDWPITRSKAFLELSHHVEPEFETKILLRAFETAMSIPDTYIYLKKSILENIVERIPRLSSSEVLSHIVHLTCEYDDTTFRSIIWDKIAARLATLPADASFLIFRKALHVLSLRRRADLLSDLCLLIPVIKELGGTKALATSSSAFVEISYWISK